MPHAHTNTQHNHHTYIHTSLKLLLTYTQHTRPTYIHNTHAHISTAPLNFALGGGGADPIMSREDSFNFVNVSTMVLLSLFFFYLGDLILFSNLILLFPCRSAQFNRRVNRRYEESELPFVLKKASLLFIDLKVRRFGWRTRNGSRRPGIGVSVSSALVLSSQK